MRRSADPAPDNAATRLRATVAALIDGRTGAAPLFAMDERVVVAVSGGPDSVCLLDCLASLAARRDLRLHVAHVHHGLRGADADADAALVVAQAEQLRLPCTVLRVDVAAHRQRRRSLQDAARRARYGALGDLAQALGGACIATGHTLDDQAETILMHLLRGSGIDGLAGMPRRRHDLVRPLLDCTRGDIEAYCAARGLAWRTDGSNASQAYMRNRLRLDLLPHLAQYNVRVREALARSAAILSRDADFLDQLAVQALEDITVQCAHPPLPPHCVIDRARYAALSPSLRMHTLRHLAQRVVGTRDGLTLPQLERAEQLLLSGRGGTLRLPHRLGLQVGSDTARLWVIEHAHGAQQEPGLHAVVLVVPGTVRVAGWEIQTRRGPPPAQWPRGDTLQDDGSYRLWCPAALAAGLRVRMRRDGDRLRLFGRGGTRKLQDLFVDHKVPRAARDSVPIIESDGGILWVVGVAAAEGVRIGALQHEAVEIVAWPRTNRP